MQRVCALNNYISKYREYFLISFLVFVAFALRLYRITEQSIWHEEYVYIANIKICDLWTNIKLLFINVPEYGLSPAGLVLYFFWVRIFPNTIWIWRLLPICFGILSIILLYFLGKWVKDWKVGFLAGMLMALSPFNIYIHQELKGYSFVLFLSLLSWFAFIKYLFNHKQNRWLVINTMFNFLLPWFHGLYIIVPLTQFPLLLLQIKSEGKIRRKIFYWVIINGLVIVPFFFWELWINPPAYNLTLTIMEQLTPKFIIASLFGVDCVGISNELLPHWKTNTMDVVKDNIWRTIISKWFVIDYLLLLFIVLCVFVYCCYLVMGLGKERKNLSRSTVNRLLLIYLFVSSFLPFLCIRIITGKPFFLPLYFYHSVAFLYLIISNVVFLSNKYWVRVYLSMCVLSLFFIQSMSLVNSIVRPDYKSAMSYLEQNIKKDDTVLDLELGANVFEPWKIYKHRDDYKFEPVFSLQGIANTVMNMFSDKESYKQDRCLWILMETSFIVWIYKVDPTYMLVKYLSPLGINVKIKHFPGKFNLYILKIEKDIYKEFKKQKITIPPFSEIDYRKLMVDFNMYYEGDLENQRKEQILREYFSIRPPFFSYNYILILGAMLQNGEIETADKICSYLINNYPQFYHAMFIKGLILLDEGKKHEAEEEVKKVFSSNYIFKSLYKNIWEKHKDVKSNKATNEILFLKRMEKEGYHILNKPIMSIIFR